MASPKKRALLVIHDESDQRCALSGSYKEVFDVRFSDGLSGPLAWPQILNLLKRRLDAKSEKDEGEVEAIDQ